MRLPKLHADFNGHFGYMLCLSHDDTCLEDQGRSIQLYSGMEAIAFNEDFDENGKRDDLIVTGTVERSPVRSRKW
jgi:hypothetical protein